MTSSQLITLFGTATAVVVLVAACGKDKAKTPAKPLDVAGVNALVPDALKAKLTFEETTIVEGRGKRKTSYKLAAPKGWKQEMESFATLKPDTDLGFMTRFEVGTNCDGACESKDWAKTVEKVYASQLQGKLLKDEKSPTRRTIIAEASDGDTLVVVAWWTDGAKQYFHCGGHLDKQLKEAAPAFEKACESVSVED